MRITSKTIAWSWVVLLIIIGSMIYGAYSKLNPDALVSLLDTQIQKTYPGSKLEIAKINYGFSLDFKLKLKQINLTRSGKTLASAKEVQLKVPWWLILFNRGNASVNVSDLIVFVSSEASKEKISNNNDQAPQTLSPKIKVQLPQYLLDAHYTLRAKNVSVKEIDGKRRFFSLSKLLVREFQYGKNSAFELNVPISVSHKDKKYVSDLWLFGDVTPTMSQWAIKFRGELKTQEAADGFQLDNIVIDGKSSFNPLVVDLVSDLSISIDKKNVGKGRIEAKYDRLDLDLTFNNFPMDFFTLLSEEIKNPFLRNIKGMAKGNVKYSRTFSDDASAGLSANVSFPGNFELSPETAVEGIWNVSIENEMWKTSFLSPQEMVKFSRESVMDYSKGSLIQYNQELHFTTFDLNKALLAVRPLHEFINPTFQMEHSSSIVLTNCTEGERVINGSFRYGVTSQQSYYLVQLIDKKIKFNLKYAMKKEHQLSAEFSNFPWHPSYNFLLPYFSATDGLINGKIEGKWEKHWSDGKWLVKLEIDKLQNLSGSFFDLNQKVWDFYQIDTALTAKRKWNGNISNNTIKLNSLVLEGSDSAQISGILSTAPKIKSYLTLSYPQNKKFIPVKKEVVDIFWIKEAP